MGLRGLRYFLTAVEEMNFHRAAEKLFITQQTLSVHIQKLEQQYGTVLFERKPRLSLTPAGASLAAYARRAIKLEEDFLSELADISNSAPGRLNVGITGFRGTIFMPRIWELFHVRFPNIIPNMTEAPTWQLDDLLMKSKLNLYIGVDAPKRKDTQVWTLCKEKACCVASKDFVKKNFSDELLEKARTTLNISDLQDLPLITFSQGNTLRESLDFYFQEHRMRPRIVFETSRHDLTLRFCEQGYGIGLVYQMSLYEMLQKQLPSNLAVFPVRNDFPLKHTNLVYRRESSQPRYHLGFIEASRQAFSEYSEVIDDLVRQASEKTLKELA